MWLLMITLHTISATICFVAGVGALSATRAREHSWLLPLFFWSLIGMTVFVSAAVASHWSELSGLTRGIFSALVVLAIYMTYRGSRAYMSLRHRTITTETYMDDVGFVLISLFNGFVIVAAIDLGAPGWAVGIGAVLAVVAGRSLVHRAKGRELGARA